VASTGRGRPRSSGRTPTTGTGTTSYLYAPGLELQPDLCDGYPGFTYTFDTTGYADGSEHVLHIDDEGSSATNEDDEVTTSGTFTIDNTPPETTSFLDATQGDDGWFTTDVTVELSGSDETGNVEDTNELRLELDDTAPELTRDRPQPGGVYVRRYDRRRDASRHGRGRALRRPR
jgi:hypothetical protein